MIPADKQTINNIQPAKEKEAKNSTELLEYHNQNEKNEEIVEINKNTNNIVFLIPILTTLLIGISIFAYYRINKKV